MNTGRFRYKCKVPGCKNQFYSPITDANYKNKKFFSFPEHPERRQQWIQKLNLEFSSERAYVCEDHFNDKDFTSSLKKRLQKYALPTIEKCYLHTDISLPSTSFSVCSDLYTTPESDSTRNF